jgi:hypothetical protein
MNDRGQRSIGRLSLTHHMNSLVKLNRRGPAEIFAQTKA